MPLSREERSVINRQNAAKSTGPRTARGKAVAAGNAMRHGIFAQRLILPGEEPAELSRLKRGLLQSLEPRNALEMELVERIVVITWKLRRLQRIERAAYVYEDADWDASNDREAHGLDEAQAVPPEVIWHTCNADARDNFQQIERQEYRLESRLNRTLQQYMALRKSQLDDEGSPYTSKMVKLESTADALREVESIRATSSEIAQPIAPAAEAINTDSSGVDRANSPDHSVPEQPATATASQVHLSSGDAAIKSAGNLETHQAEALAPEVAPANRSNEANASNVPPKTSNEAIGVFLSDESIPAELRQLLQPLQQSGHWLRRKRSGQLTLSPDTISRIAS